MYLAIAAAAIAATPVIHAGDPTEAVTLASRASGIALWELRPVGLSELFPGEGALRVGAAQPTACEGSASSNAELRELVALAEKLYLRQSWDGVRAKAAEAGARLACLGEGAEPSQLARLAFLDGFAAAELGDVGAARLAFTRARAWDPALRWDERVSGAGRAPFEAAATPSGPDGVLLVGVGGASLGTVWAVDGRVVALLAEQPLRPGRHLVQTLQPVVRTWEVDLEPGQVVALVDAATARSTVLGESGQPAARAILTAAIHQRLGPGAPALVVDGRQVWEVGREWIALSVPADAEAAAVPVARSRLSAGLLGAGIAATALGGAAAAAAAITRGEADAAEAGETDQTYLWRNRLYKDAGTLAGVGAAVAGAGVVCAAVGAIMGLPPGAPGVSVAPQGNGAMLVAWTAF